jgi:hypothetical protein
MNFLELVQRLHYEAGASGSAPSSVVGQTGLAGDLVRWVQNAYLDIQGLHNDWNFLRDEFSKSTEADKAAYSLSDLSMTDLRKWIVDDIRIYSDVSDETQLEYLPWNEFRPSYVIGSARTDSNRPNLFSIKPDKSIIFAPVPNGVFTFNGEYWKLPTELSGDDGAHLLSYNEMAIVWRACMYYAQDDGADDLYAVAERDYNRMIRELETTELPEFTWGNPLV